MYTYYGQTQSECENLCDTKGETLAVPMSEQNYSCLIDKAGGTGTPLWTGMRLTRLGIIDNKHRWFVKSFGRSDQYNFRNKTFQFQGLDFAFEDGKDCIYFHNDLYVLSSCSRRTTSYGKAIDIRCACQRGKACTSSMSQLAVL